jgi:sarcosine oxidase subunit alpha
LNTVEKHDRIRLYTGTLAAAYYTDHWIPLVDRDRLTKMRAKAVIMANGAYEQPAVFRNNDLPGVMLASAAQRLIYRYAVKPMNRAVVLTANSDGYRAALDLAQHGVEVKAIADLRPTYTTNPITQALQTHGIPIFTSHCVYEAKTHPASDGVSNAVICPIDANGKPQAEFKQALAQPLLRRIACDGIIMSVGWAPAANLLYQAGTKMRFDDHLQQFVPDQLPTGVFACGRVNGVYEFEQKLLDGRRAGLEAVMYLGYTTSVGAKHSGDKLYSSTQFSNPNASPFPIDRTLQESPSHPWAIMEHPVGKNFVDFDEDLQFKDFPNAAQEGFDNIELLKRYTTVGMGPSQGKHSNMNALRILARITGKSPGEVGTTTARPFFHRFPCRT